MSALQWQPSHRNVVCGDLSESKCGALSESLVGGDLSESVCGDLSESGPCQDRTLVPSMVSTT